jgi:undecaprenyl-diphosphatase
MNMRHWLALDHRWTQSLRLRDEHRLGRLAAAVLAHSGDSWFWGAGLVLLFWRGQPPQKVWALYLLVAISGLAAAVLLIKFLIRRRRPEGEWGNLYRRTDPHSFPSGHAARAFLIAALVSAWGPSWLAPWLLAWAPLVALARVAMGLHYLSDVVGGALLGLAAALAAVEILP